MNRLCAVLPPFTVGLLIFAPMLQAASQEPVDQSGVHIQRQEQNGITYLSGGVGEDEAKAIRQSTGYNLQMTLSIGAAGKFVPDVEVVIHNAQGQAVLTLREAGPLVYVQLPPGRYSVVASRHGETRRDNAEVGSGPRQLVFNFQGDE